MEKFSELKRRLEMTNDHRLMLESVPMVLMPRWFFGAIMRCLEETAGKETAQKVYYDAAFEGAYKWGQAQVEKGLKGREIMEQYLGSLSIRGWGGFEIIEMDIDQGRGIFRLHNSATAQELGQGTADVCYQMPGAMVGAFQLILDKAGIDLKVEGREVKCLAQGDSYCEYVVAPVGK